VAREYRVSESELAEANQLRENDSIQGVEALVVPVAPAAAPSARATLLYIYTARKGDTLVTIADRFGVSLAQLRRWNKIDGVKVAPGRRLHVGEPASGTRATRGRHHKAADATVDETRGNAHEAESAVKKRHARSRKSASSAEKSGASGATEAHAKKPVAKRKSPTRKEK
jgi:membrane-bound lytic murein transglycosylase D